MESTPNNTGWVVSIVLAAIGATKYIWDYLKQRSENETKIKLHEDDKYSLSKEELTKQYNELMVKFTDIEHNFEVTDKKLDRFLIAFEIILPIIQKTVENNPEYKSVIDKALKHLTV